MTSPFEKFLDELEAERKGPAKPGVPGQPGTAPGGPLEAVMSDSGLFDANAMVPGKAPGARGPAVKAPPAPPGEAGGLEAVMSDSGLFDANAMVPAAKSQPPGGMARPGAAPSHPAGNPVNMPPAHRPSGMPPSGARPGGPQMPGAAMPGAAMPGAAMPGAGNRGAPLPPPSPAMHKPPSLSHRAPNAGNSEPVMSDSGLFDVRELMAERPQAKAASPSGSAGASVAPSGASAPGRPGPVGSGAVNPLAAPAGRTGPVGSGAVNPLAAPAGRPGGKMPTIDDNPIMSDSGLFDVREMIPDYGGKPPAGTAPTGPIGPVPRSQSAVMPANNQRSASAVMPANQPSAAATTSRANLKPASGVSELSRSSTMRASPAEGSKASIKPVTSASLGGPGSASGELSRTRMQGAGGPKPVSSANIGSGSSGRLPPTRPAPGVAVAEPSVMSNTGEHNAEGGSNTILLVVLLVVVLVGGAAAAFFMGAF